MIKCCNFLIDYSKHSLERFYDRIKNLDLDDIIEIVKKGIKKIVDDDIDYKVVNDFLIFSKSLNQGVVVSYKNDRNLFRIVTILPPGKKYPTGDTELVLTEDYFDFLKNIYGNQLANYINQISKNQLILENINNLNESSFKLEKINNLNYVVVKEGVYDIEANIIVVN